MSSFCSLLVVFLATFTVVYGQSTVVTPGYVFDPTGTPVNTNYPISNIINGDWSASPGWNPTVPDLNAYNYFYAQFGWSSGSTGGFDTSNLLVTGFTVSMSADGIHRPGIVGVIAKGGSNVSQAIQTWTVPPAPTQQRQTESFTFGIAQPLSNFTVFFYNNIKKFQVYIYQIQFLAYKAITPVTAIDPYYTVPSIPGCVVGNIIQPNNSYWNPSFPAQPQMNRWFYTVFTLPPLGPGLQYNITGFEVLTALDGDHSFSTVGLSLGYQKTRDNVVQNFGFTYSSLTPSGQPNGWPQGWASFTLSTPVQSDQLSLYFYNGNSKYQIYLAGVRFYTASIPSSTCNAGYYNAGSVTSPVCVACPAGTFKSVKGLQACTTCSPGFYTTNSGSISCDQPCPANSYWTGPTTCASCPADNPFSLPATVRASDCCRAAADNNDIANSIVNLVGDAGTFFSAYAAVKLSGLDPLSQAAMILEIADVFANTVSYTTTVADTYAEIEYLKTAFGNCG